jgi:hypothetical protein
MSFLTQGINRDTSSYILWGIGKCPYFPSWIKIKEQISQTARSKIANLHVLREPPLRLSTSKKYFGVEEYFGVVSAH